MPPPISDNFLPVVITPTYNNERTLCDVLTRIAAQELPLIVVNDGCTDSTSNLLKNWMRNHPRASAQVVDHAMNLGKAAALRSGFHAAIEAGFTHAITLDTDGQHDPEEIPVLLTASQQNPNAYVLGYRDETAPDYPAGSRLGRKISNLLVFLESGARVRDSQCGMRVYPLDLVRRLRCRAEHFGFETEIITRAAWSGCPLAEAPIVTRYQPSGQRVSHFRPWLDSLRAIRMHAHLFLRALWPLPHRKYTPGELDKSPREPLGRRLWAWLNPSEAWRELRRGNLRRTEISTALAVGVFIAMLPAYGLQTIICLYTARRLHLHPLAVITGSHVSIPPVAPFLIGAAIAVGHLILHGHLPTWPPASSGHIFGNLAGSLLLDWAVGGVLIGAVLGAGTFVLSQMLLSSFEPTAGNAAANPQNAEAPPTTRWAFKRDQSMQTGR